jgi:hypothetical protein
MLLIIRPFGLLCIFNLFKNIIDSLLEISFRSTLWRAFKVLPHTVDGTADEDDINGVIELKDKLLDCCQMILSETSHSEIYSEEFGLLSVQQKVSPTKFCFPW